MKSTKSILIAALATGALLTCGSLMAADTNSPTAGERGPGGMRSHADIATALGLTDEQKPKVEKIMKDNREKRTALRSDTSLSQEDKRAKTKSIQQETTSQMKAVLTPEQFAKYEKMMPGKHRPSSGSENSGQN